MSRAELKRDVWEAANIMRSDDGTNGIHDYIEQISWMVFLKVFEDLENRYEAESRLKQKKHQRIIPKKYSWSSWTELGTQEIIEFIDDDLIPFLGTLSGSPERDTIGVIFGEVKRNKMKSASNLKDVVDIINDRDFNDAEDSHVFSQFYEDLLVKLGRESGIAGEFYTPRPIVRLMVKIINPKLKSIEGKPTRILDPFCGSCGFLVESYLHIMSKKETTVKDFRNLQLKVFHGFEKKSLPYLVGIMNCILHGLLTPSVIRKNTLRENIENFRLEDKFEYIFTNPPFGGKESKTIQQNFPVKIQKTEFLGLQSVMKRLAEGGECAIVMPEPILWRTGKYLKVRKDLVENSNIHTIISLPAGVFANVTASGLGPKTNLVFFSKKGTTKQIWYYELTPPGGKSYSRVNTIKDEHLEDCFKKWKKKEESNNSWILKKEDIDENYDLTANNPNIELGFKTENPNGVISRLIDREKIFPSHLEKIKKHLLTNKQKADDFGNWDTMKIVECVLPEDENGIQGGFACAKNNEVKEGIPHLRPFNVGKNGKLHLSEFVFLPENLVDTELFSLQKGDVIFNNTNSKELVGKSALVEKNLTCGFSNHLTRLRVRTEIISPEWLVLTLRLHWLSGVFLKKSRKWIGQAGINTDSLSATEIPVPDPDIQKEIVGRLRDSTKILDDIAKLRNEIQDDMGILRASIFKYLILNK